MTYAGRILYASMVLFCLLVIASTPVLSEEGEAQEEKGTRTLRQETRLLDPGIPLGAVRSYLEACRKREYREAASFLNLENVPPEDRSTLGPRLAWQMKVVLDRKLPIYHEPLSLDSTGQDSDGLPEGLDRLGTIGNTEILLERLRDDEDRWSWKFSSGTVARIPELYQEHGYGYLGEYLPARMFEIQFLDLQLWQWTGLMLLLLAVWLLSWIGTRVVYAIVRPLVVRTETSLDDQLLNNILSPFRFLLTVGLFALGTVFLALPLTAYDLLGGVEKALVVVGIAWVAVRIVDILVSVYRQRFEEEERGELVAMLPLGSKAIKVFLILIALVAMLQNLGFNVTGILAGLGVGGLAVALAAQKSIANLFGGVSLVADQPVRVGDFCRFGDGKMGTVEEIGLRSTRVRTLDRTLITVPNSDFSEIQLENYGVRDRVRLFAVLGLRYETGPDQLRYVLTEIRKLLIAHPMVTDTPARARFIGFGAYSLDVEVFAYIQTSDWNEFLKIREDIFLRFMDIVRESGTGFAFPSQTLYLGRDDGLEAERTSMAEDRVKAWRANNDLPFPDFSEAFTESIDGTADYPPTGSVTGTHSEDDPNRSPDLADS